MSNRLRKLQRRGMEGPTIRKFRQDQALEKLNEAMGALHQLTDLKDNFAGIQELDKLIRETHAVVNAVVGDCQEVANENEILRETFLRLLVTLSGDPEEHIRKVEELIRAKVIEERT